LTRWTDIDSVKKHFVEKMDDDMVLVTPRQLAKLYKQARKNGWAK